MKDYSNYYPSFKDVTLENGRLIFEQQLKSSEGNDILIDEVPTKALIRYHQNPLNEFKENRKIILWHEDSIKRGSIVKTLKDDRVFLVLSKINQNDLVKYALIREINHNLKWIDSNNNLITKPCIVSAKTLYTTGIKDEKVIDIPDGMVGIQLPYDEDTKKLDRQQSFVFNKTKYEITFYNEVEFNGSATKIRLDGLMVLICTETELSHLDDKVNEIADRWVKVEDGGKVDRLPWLDDQQPPDELEPPEELTEGITYTIIGQPQYSKDPDDKIYSGDWCKYTIHKFIDGTEVEGKFTFAIDNDKLATITNSTDNTVTITAKDVVKGGDIKLTVTDAEINEIVIEKVIKIIGY